MLRKPINPWKQQDIIEKRQKSIKVDDTLGPMATWWKKVSLLDDCFARL